MGKTKIHFSPLCGNYFFTLPVNLKLRRELNKNVRLKIKIFKEKRVLLIEFKIKANFFFSK